MDQGFDNFHSEAVPEPVNPELEAAPQGSGFWDFVRDTAETLILAVVMFLAIDAVSARIRVDGMCMYPTLNDGQFVFVNRLAYKFGEPAHGDIIVFHYPRDPEQEFVKRIIGLPGDTVDIRGGQVYVNGMQLYEPYIADAPRTQGSWTVPEDHLFVLGDNRNNSQDSRSFGFVSMDEVIGKALFIYWPPSDWGSVAHTELNIPPPGSGTSAPTPTPYPTPYTVP